MNKEDFLKELRSVKVDKLVSELIKELSAKETLSPLDAIAGLDSLSGPAYDWSAHVRADQILLAVLRSEGLQAVAEAYELAEGRIGFCHNRD